MGNNTASLILVPPVCLLVVDELSKVKRDLEAALRDVLQAMRVNQDTFPSDAAINIPSLERLANVSISHAVGTQTYLHIEGLKIFLL